MDKEDQRFTTKYLGMKGWGEKDTLETDECTWRRYFRVGWNQNLSAEVQNKRFLLEDLSEASAHL
jgi:hypothetical protein